MREFKNLENERFGRLLVVSVAPRGKFNEIRWNCKCECGRESVVSASSLRNGTTKSCGCLKSELLKSNKTIKNFRHGGTNTSEYSSWTSMRDRCKNPKNVGWKSHGGRGIKVCSRWNDFKNFLQDMGKKPDGFWIDRINNNGHYVPSNCQWVSPSENLKNTRRQKDKYPSDSVEPFVDVF